MQYVCMHVCMYNSMNMLKYTNYKTANMQQNI